MLIALASVILAANTPPTRSAGATARATVRVVAGYKFTPGRLEIPSGSRRRIGTISADDGARLAADLVEFQ